MYVNVHSFTMIRSLICGKLYGICFKCDESSNVNKNNYETYVLHLCTQKIIIFSCRDDRIDEMFGR